MFSLQGFNALVTGASGGIGSAIAISLAKQGATIVLSGTRAEALQETANEIKKIGGISHTVLCNLSDAQSVE